MQFCLFNFKNSSGEILKVVTAGEEDQKVDNWSIVKGKGD